MISRPSSIADRPLDWRIPLDIVYYDQAHHAATRLALRATSRTMRAELLGRGLRDWRSIFTAKTVLRAWKRAHARRHRRPYALLLGPRRATRTDDTPLPLWIVL